jgi:hypothetical protein
MDWIISQRIRSIVEYESELVDSGERWLNHRVGRVSISDPVSLCIDLFKSIQTKTLKPL